MLALSHATSQRFDGPSADDSVDAVGERVDAVGEHVDAVGECEDVADDSVAEGGEMGEVPRLSQPLLLLNVALSQGAFGVVLVVAAVLASVPRTALGVADQHFSVLAVVLGVAFGTVLYAANEVGGSVADAYGFGRGDELRELLAPASRTGWVILLGGVLPVVATFEELLFRGVLVGAFAAGAGVSPWLLVVPASILFGLGHGTQGRMGVVVTTALGAVLAAAFVVTGSLLVVVVAHYLVNALEFVVHEHELGHASG
nr:CPBP family intramembrane glutamic endopeptidase [Halorubellus sp. JP-L1]